MILPFCMTVAGTIPLLIALILWFFQKRTFDASFGIRLLKCSMFFYLVPIQLVCHLLPSQVLDLFYYRYAEDFSANPVFFYFENKVSFSAFGKLLLIPYWFIALSVLCMLFIIVFTIYQFAKYQRCKKILVKTSVIRKQFVNDKTVDVLVNSSASAPYSIGFFQSYIVVPKSMANDADSSMLYNHELSHIKNYDALKKFLCLIILCIHWYNPFSWMLFFLYGVFSEYICDMDVTKDFTGNEKKKYSTLLVMAASQKAPLPAVWQNNFSNSKSNLKRRITYIMKNTNKNFSHKFLIAFFCFLSILASASTVFAYQPMEHIYEKDAESDNVDYIALYPDDYLYPIDNPLASANTDFSSSDAVIVWDDGSQAPVFSENNMTRNSCSHTYQSGQLQQHRSDGKGGCSITIYQVTICSKCNFIKSKTYENKITFSKCPHK